MPVFALGILLKYSKVNGSWASLYRALAAGTGLVNFIFHHITSAKLHTGFLVKPIQTMKKWQILCFLQG
jgi:hypothetical protein